MFDRTLNRIKFYRSFDRITVDWTNALESNICSIEPSIMSSSIDPYILSQSIGLMHYNRLDVRSILESCQVLSII
jgi:hypothetical protein